MNPVMVLKWSVVTLVAGVAAIAERMIRRAGILMLMVSICWYAFVVGHNIMVLLDFFTST